ncbi:hypothetical protein FTO70_16830 [Methanosarcina sp. KYL-1]|uniref:zinc finger domain-containing protein n=1 Tax=Methanosarcina sp. KYL-1 TaxID=2602068 RepID=UPI002100D004|nr:zinc finger domain-containing protein [Methanosarcina sp. KYL-1]MCQ1537306.1 hypothetical protein [Methanosarcina sp. KYL-1]
MLESLPKCIRCGTALKKQVLGSNTLYYCRKCGCTSSATAINTSAVASVQQMVNI